MSEHRIFTAGFGSVYPLYVQKAERKGRTREEVNEIICWLTGYRPEELEKQIDALKDEVKAYMDEEGKELEETGDFVVRYATIHLTRFDTTRFKKEQEALYLAYLTQATQRRFTFKTKGVA